LFIPPNTGNTHTSTLMAPCRRLKSSRVKPQHERYETTHTHKTLSAVELLGTRVRTLWCFAWCSSMISGEIAGARSP
jgi:hypothetical protein